MAELHQRYDLLLSPTLATAPPELGELSPVVDFEPLLERVAAWMPYTPIANAAGTPAISMPMGFDDRRGLPIGAMLSADFGADALLLQTALELEQAHPSALSQLAA
jgi:amidase